MNDLFENIECDDPIHVNIYADEIQGLKCPITGCIWHYIGIIVEDLQHPLLEAIINERFKGNIDKNSEYYNKNNKIVHWSQMRIADTKNICKRWFEYILNPEKSKKTFYSYILGINDSYLENIEFGTENNFNSKYNRFFRTAILYSLKMIFSGKKIIVNNIFHEEGQQQYYQYFPWHTIYKLSADKQISFRCNDITFLPKDHKNDIRSNLIQLCDAVLGVSASILHGIEKSRASKYREELASMYVNLFKDIIKSPYNKNSKYNHCNRIMIRFFPKEKTILGDIRRLRSQFFTNRRLYYLDQISGQQCFSI